jgi:ligand-binding sensor domain-containing protein
LSSRIKRYILILLLVQQTKQSLFAQAPDYHVQKISKNSGLANNSQIREVMKDNKGFLWLMVASKILRFDGKNLVSFSFDEVCVSITQDEDGTVWLATRQNIYRFQNDHSGFEEIRNYRSETPLYRRLITGPGKKLYLLSNDGIRRWSKTTNKFESFGIKPLKSSGSYPFLKSAGDYLFYKLDDSTLARYNTATAVVDHARVMDANFLFLLNKDSVFVRQFVGNSVLVSFAAGTITTIEDKQINGKMPGGRFFVRGLISRSPSEYLLLVDDMGCLVYNTHKNNFNKVNFYYDGQPLKIKPFPILNNFYREENGNVWLVNEDGLVYFNPDSKVLNLLSSDGDWNNDIRNFTEDNQHNIWFSTANGFCKWDKSTGIITSWLPKFDAENYLNYSSIRSISFMGGKLLVGQSEKGFWIFDPVTEVFKRLPFENDSVKKIFNRDFNHNGFKLRNGNFIALSNKTWLIEKETFAVREITLHDSVDAFRCGYEDAQGRIWLLGRGGIFAVDSNFNELYALPDKVRGRWYNAIVQIDTETFWVAAKTIFELKLQPNRKLSIRPLFPELKNAHFSHFFKDSLQRIWMCNERGMYRYVPEKHFFEKYDNHDNVKNFYISISNSFRGSDGTVYFGSTDGINYFVPEKNPPAE